MHIRTICFVCSLYAAVATADDWPQWRGPTRDGVWRETGLLESFPDDQLPPRWQHPIGSGYSGPTVAAGRVFVSDRQTEPRQRERIICLDAATGDVLWTFAYDCVYKLSYTAGPRASITVDQGRAYALGAMGHLHCLDAASGSVLWQADLADQFDADVPVWGISAAPLIVDDMVILHIGGRGACVVALDKLTGAERWRALDDRPSYSAPILIQQAGRPVVVCWNGDSVAGLDPARGTVYWRYAFPPTRMPIGVATPVVAGDRLFVSSFYDGSLMLRLDDQRLDVQRIWQRRGPNERNTDSLHCMISTPLILDDHVYGVDSYGQLRCLQADTGDRVWEDLTATPADRWSNIHMVRNGQRMWMFNERGELIIGRLSPRGFDEIDRTRVIEPTQDQLPRRDGVCWSHPAYANRHIFIRNDRRILCASLAAAP
jgi:outer membrane protein assembly factor BamB